MESTQETQVITPANLEILPANALESLERASVDIQIATAHKYPRSVTQMRQRMMNLATLDEETAESCFYVLRRQGKSIEGPSVRLAEIAAHAFGNIRSGARVISNDGKQITAQGFCHDLESNNLISIEVKRRITDRSGNTYSDDMQVVTGNAACSIALRNATFKVVPFAMIKPVYLAAKKAAVGDLTTLTERRTKMLKKFASLGLNEKRVCAGVGKAGVEEIGLEELGALIGIWSALQSGDTTVEEAFPESAVSTPIRFGDGEKGAETEEMKQAAPKPRAKKEKEVKESEAAPPRATPLQTVRNLMTASKIEEGPLLAHLFGGMLIDQGDTLDKLPEAKLQIIIDKWLEIGTAMTATPKE